jgi:hypothetical protein
MGKKSSPSPPPPPDPQAVASAQTGSNLTTAIGNSYLSNANQVGPHGTTSTEIAKWHQVTDPSSGATYNVPQFQQVTKLSPEQQQLYNQQNQLGSKMNNLAISQTDKLQGILSKPVNTSSLPQGGNIPGSGPQYSGLSGGPSLSRVNLQSAPTTFAGAGQQQTQFSSVAGPQSTFGSAGDIQRSIGPTDYSADRQRVEEALFSRLNPQLDRDRASLENRLVNQGLVRGSEAFTRAMDESNRQATDARMQAILAGGSEQSRLANLALQSGQFANQAQQQDYSQQLGRGQFANDAQGQTFAQAQARGQFANAAQAEQFQQAQARGLFGLGAIDQNNQTQLSGAGFNNAANQQQYENLVRQQQYGNDVAGRQFSDQMSIAQAQETQRERGLQEQLALRNQPINEISALMSGGQVNMPQFTPYQGGQIANTPIGDYTYNSAALGQQNYKMQMEQQNAAMGGLFGLGQAGIGAAAKLAPMMMFSDRRLKHDIIDIGVRLLSGVKLYAYRYVGEAKRRVGVMADEVAKVNPAAVHNVGGFLAVDYGELR